MTLKEFNSMCHAADMDGVDEYTFGRLLEVYTSDDRISKQNIFDLYVSGRSYIKKIELRISAIKATATKISECNSYAFTDLLDQLDNRRTALVDEVTKTLSIINVGK